MKPMGYQFEIQYRPGHKNKAADALSHVNHLPSLMALTLPAVVQLE